MKALLIDSVNRTITPTEIRDWRDIAPAIGADLFDVVGFDDFKHSIYVDDEGLYTKSTYFQLRGYPQPLAGNGLVLGYDEDTGDSIDCSLSIEQLKQHIRFI